MAIALHFRRIMGPEATDHDTTVTYEYGPSPRETPNQVVIDLAADTARAADGTWGDPKMSMVVGTVMRLREETGRWPEKGDRFS